MNRFWVLALLITACQAHAEPPAEQKRLEPATVSPQHSVNPRLTVNNAPSTSQSKAPSAPNDKVALTAEQIELVDRFVAKDVLALTPDQATVRFANRPGLKKEREFDDGFLLAGGSSATERVEFTYAPDGKGKFYASVATLGFYGSNARVPKLKNALTELLTKKLGKRRKPWSTDEDPYWKLKGRVEVGLLEYAPRHAPPGERVVELRVSEPDGP